MFGNGPKTNRVARGHDGLPVSSKTPPLPQLRQPLRAHRGEMPISGASATPRSAQPRGLAGTPAVPEGAASRDARAEARREKARYPAPRARERPEAAGAGLLGARSGPRPRRAPRRGNAAEGGWKGGRAVHSRKGAAVLRRLGDRDAHANRKSGPREPGGSRGFEEG